MVPSPTANMTPTSAARNAETCRVQCSDPFPAPVSPCHMVAQLAIQFSYNLRHDVQACPLVIHAVNVNHCWPLLCKDLILPIRLVTSLPEAHDMMVCRYCAAPFFNASQVIPAVLSGPSLVVTLTTGTCAIVKNMTKGDKIDKYHLAEDSLTCVGPQLSYTKV